MNKNKHKHFPLVAGGQGRTVRDTVDTAAHLIFILFWAAIIVACCAIWTCLASSCGLTQ